MSERLARARRYNSHSMAVRMEARRFGYFPQTFVWRGERYDVLTVEKCWTVTRRWLWNVERHYFRVHCDRGTFELYHDARDNTWHAEQF